MKYIKSCLEFNNHKEAITTRRYKIQLDLNTFTMKKTGLEVWEEGLGKKPELTRLRIGHTSLNGTQHKICGNVDGKCEHCGEM